MKKILIIEDDHAISSELITLLSNNGYGPSLLDDFDDTVTKIIQENPDLILLDINIPGLNGQTVLKNLRQKSTIPVIMVTSRDTEMDEALSISYGADDYITKPYNPNILLLRIEAILRRVEPNDLNHKIIQYHNLEYNTEKGEIIASSLKINLTKNEMLIFNYLLHNQNRIVSRRELMTLLWDNSSYLNDSTLTVNISRLREKLAKAGLKNAISTRKGQGYLLT